VSFFVLGDHTCFAVVNDDFLVSNGFHRTYSPLNHIIWNHVVLGKSRNCWIESTKATFHELLICLLHPQRRFEHLLEYLKISEHLYLVSSFNQTVGSCDAHVTSPITPAFLPDLRAARLHPPRGATVLPVRRCRRCVNDVETAPQRLRTGS